MHKKKQYCDRVAICWKYSSCNCSYGDTECWFKHDQNNAVQESTIIKCTLCDQEFERQAEVLKHKKQQHRSTVSKCNNQKGGKCTFGDRNCWFIHDDLEKEHSDGITKEQSDVLQKVFGMLEKMTERITNMEKYGKEGKNENDKKDV